MFLLKGQFIRPAKASTGYTAEERRLQSEYNAVFLCNTSIRFLKLLRNALHWECNAHERIWENSLNLVHLQGGRQRGEEPGAEPVGAIVGESVTGTNFCSDLWNRHPNFSSAEQQHFDLRSKGGKIPTLGHALNYLKGREESSAGRTGSPLPQGVLQEDASCLCPHEPEATR